MNIWMFLLLVFTLIPPFHLLGEVERETRMREMVVTATRTEVEVEKAPCAVELITREDLERRNVRTLVDALKAFPGICVRESKGLMDSLMQVNLRGMPYERRNLILLDGVPMNGGYYGGIKTFWQGFSVDNLEKVEVVKGPFSSLYGGGAMGGAVSFFTRTPEKREFSISQVIGEDSYTETRIYYGDVWKNLSFMASYVYKDEDGYITQPVLRSARTQRAGSTYITATGWTITEDAYGRTYYEVGHAGDNGARAFSGFGKVQLRLSKNNKIWFSFYKAKYKYFYNDPETHLRDQNGNPVWSGRIDVGGNKYIYLKEAYFYPGPGQQKQNVYTLGFNGLLRNKLKLKTVVSLLERPDDWYTTPSSSTISRTDSKKYYLDTQISFPVFKRHIFTVGGTYERNWARSKKHKLQNWRDEDSYDQLLYRMEGKTRTYSLYVQDEISILPNLVFYVGLRQDWWKSYSGERREIVNNAWVYQDYDSNSDKELSPKLAVVWAPFEKTILRASWGKAFRPPTIYELYKTWVSSWGITYASNPNLDPETDEAWEVGITQRFKGFKFNFSYFENDLEDMVYSVSIANKFKRKENVGDARIDGFEASLERYFFDKKIRAFVNYTRYVARIVDVDMPQLADLEGKRLVLVPGKMFGGEIDINLEPFFASFVVSYRSKVYNDDLNRDENSFAYKSRDQYLVCDMKLSYKPTKWSEITFSVNNLFNKNYYQYYKAPDRKWYLGAKISF